MATTKKKIRLQTEAQKNLADYNQQIYLQNYQMQRQDALQDYANFYSPEALVRQAKAAGLNPDVVAGQAGGGSVASVNPEGGTASPGSVDANSDLLAVANTLTSVLDRVNQISRLQDEAAARRYSLEAQGIENKIKQVEFLSRLKDFGFTDKRFQMEVDKNVREEAESLRDERRLTLLENADQRSAEAHSLEMDKGDLEKTLLGKEVDWYDRKQGVEMQDAADRHRMSNASAELEEWRVGFAKTYGFLPPSNMDLESYGVMKAIKALESIGKPDPPARFYKPGEGPKLDLGEGQVSLSDSTAMANKIRGFERRLEAGDKLNENERFLLNLYRRLLYPKKYYK